MKKSILSAVGLGVTAVFLCLCCDNGISRSPDNDGSVDRFFRGDSSYTVTFSVNGGSGTAPSSQTVNAGSSITLPSGSNLSRSGYTFGGWNTSSSGTGTNYSAGSTYTPSGSITLYVRWIPAPIITTFVDSRDGKSTTYNKVRIGEQTWMAENLNYRIPGTGADTGRCYGNNTANCDTYGRLYNWSTAMNGASSSSAVPSGVRGVCPVNWHLPSDAEWTQLTDYVGSYAGRKLKSATGWTYYSASTVGTDDYGFSALPGGNGYSDGSFGNVGNGGLWWSATGGAASYAWYRIMGYLEYVVRDSYDKANLFSVRCVQD